VYKFDTVFISCMKFGTETETRSTGIIPLILMYHMTSSQEGLNVISGIKFITEYV
jgi:hypothetical protein